jgi:hypothetical protein
VILPLRTSRRTELVRFRSSPNRSGILRHERPVRSGSWDRLLELWALRFPELLDDLDVGRLANMLRGSAQWRGPSPRRSRYARNGGVAPAVHRARRRKSPAGRKRDAA